MTSRVVRRAVPAGAAVLAVLLSGCGDEVVTTSESSSSPSTTESPSPTASPTPTETPSTAAPSVDFRGPAKDAVRDGLPALVPAPQPPGWAATEASYDQDSGTWFISFETDSGSTVEMWQRAQTVAELAEEHASGTEESGTLDLTKFQTGIWSTWSGDGAQALGRPLPKTSVLLVGTTAEDVATLAKYLLTMEIDDGGEGD